MQLADIVVAALLVAQLIMSGVLAWFLKGALQARKVIARGPAPIR